MERIRKALVFTFDPVMYTNQSAEYRLNYSKKIIYYVLEVVGANQNITVNQTVGLLRNTIQIPEELTRSTIGSILTHMPPEDRILSVYESSKGVKHLKLTSKSFGMQKLISEQYPELLEYASPIYNNVKKKRDVNTGDGATP